MIATGKQNTYAGRSKYQNDVHRMELAGEGALSFEPVAETVAA